MVNNHRKPTFFTSDWHIGHERVLELDQRPFIDLDKMHKVLVNNYNACVPKNGVCYFLGDFGLSNVELLKSILSQLHGTKVMVLGNHDKNSNSMYNAGFDVVVNTATIFVAKHKVTMSHCPKRGVFREDVSKMKNSKPDDNWHGESRHFKYTVPNEGQFHLHGHIHSSPDKKVLGRQYDVGVRANNYRPVSISTIESWIAHTLRTENYFI